MPKFSFVQNNFIFNFLKLKKDSIKPYYYLLICVNGNKYPIKFDLYWDYYMIWFFFNKISYRFDNFSKIDLNKRNCWLKDKSTIKNKKIENKNNLKKNEVKNFQMEYFIEYFNKNIEFEENVKNGNKNFSSNFKNYNNFYKKIINNLKKKIEAKKEKIMAIDKNLIKFFNILINNLDFILGIKKEIKEEIKPKTKKERNYITIKVDKFYEGYIKLYIIKEEYGFFVKNQNKINEKDNNIFFHLCEFQKNLDISTNFILYLIMKKEKLTLKQKNYIKNVKFRFQILYYKNKKNHKIFRKKAVNIHLKN